MKNKLYLIDISSLIFRAFYAVRPLTTPKGVVVNAVYGVLSMIIKLHKEYDPKYVVFCYDRKEPSFRKELDDNYKANRTEMPEDLVPQMQIIKDLIEYLGMPSLEVPRYEADDIIGTLTCVALKKNFEVFIVSGDKDFAQLIEEGVYMLDTMKDTITDVKGVIERWGVRPDQFIDYLAIVGDSSDNIPGVSGIGPKGAQKLLEDYGTLDGIYQNIDAIKSASIKEKLSKSKEQAYLSQKLVTIVQDVKVPEDMDEYVIRPYKMEQLTALLTDLNFKSFEKALKLDSTLSLLTESAGEKSPSKRFPDTPKVAAAAETKAAKAAAAKALTASASIAGEASATKSEEFPPTDVKELPIDELGKTIPDSAQLEFYENGQGVFLFNQDLGLRKLTGDLSAVAQQLKGKKISWSGYDLKAIWHRLNYEYDRTNPLEAGWDTLLAYYIIYPGEENSFERIYEKVFQEKVKEMMGIEELVSVNHKIKDFLLDKIQTAEALSLYQNIELKAAVSIFYMEKKGIRLDPQTLHVQSAELAIELKKLEKHIHEQAGSEFNVGSPKQLAQILFEKLQLPATKKTKTGFSTDNEVLESLKDKHEIVASILKYREYSKLKSTYLDSLPLLVKADGRIHSHFDQALTATGRLSSTDPNLQNIPIKTEQGAKVRRAFTAELGCKLLSADYSQIELRVLAHYSSDRNLISAFENDLDIHTATAAEVFAVPLTEVTSEMRRMAKAVNFGIAYGQGAFGLSSSLGISRAEAKDIITKYFIKYPGVKNYIDSTIESAKEKGYVETLLGRKRNMIELKSNNAMVRKFGERAAINAPIQGTAADIVKIAMIELNEKISSPIILQVHDELIFENPEKVLLDEAATIKSIMENVLKLKVPLKVNYKIGLNWGEAH